MTKTISAFTLLGMAAYAQAALKLPHIFSDHAVLQRDMPVSIWGWDDAGSKVTVAFAGQSKSATAGKDGKWTITLDALSTNKDGSELSISSSSGDKAVLKDILVGEVWLASGQSNMQWNIKQVSKADQDTATAATVPLLRIATIPHVAKYELQDDVNTKWEISTPEVALRSTAVGWFFAKNLIDELDVPVGIISSNWGGSKIEPWMPDEAYQTTPYLQQLFKERQEKTPNTEAYNAKLAAYNKAAEEAKTSGAKPPKQLPVMKPGNQSIGLYQAMIHPLQPYGIRGFIWYQGESNRGESYTYIDKKKALISSWRKDFNRPDAPFYYVQLAPFIYGKTDPDFLPTTQFAQFKCLEIPHTGMAVTMDVGNVKNIHPGNKSAVGRRLALWALAKDYGKKDLIYSGPLYESAKVENNKIVVTFKHSEGLKTSDGQAPSFLEVAGEDGKWYPATGEIKESNLIVTSPQVSKLVEARYAWTHAAQPNLVNAAGLPASPFHTNFPARK